MRWGELSTSRSGPGDFIFVPLVPTRNQRLDRGDARMRPGASDNESVVANLDIEPARTAGRGSLDRSDHARLTE